MLVVFSGNVIVVVVVVVVVFVVFVVFLTSPDSSVGKLTGYGLAGPGFDSW
jgi:hypothetical protein